MNTSTPSSATTGPSDDLNQASERASDGSAAAPNPDRTFLTSVNETRLVQSQSKSTMAKEDPGFAANAALSMLGDGEKMKHDEERDEDLDDEDDEAKSRMRGDEDVPMTFPQRLMEILSKEDHSDIISWLPHGRGFMIYQKKRFAAEILPKYFKKSKFTSFTRKLNRWNFTRITRGPETGAYYHEFFQKGNLRLCMQMSCQNSKNQQPPTGGAVSSTASTLARLGIGGSVGGSGGVPGDFGGDLTSMQTGLGGDNPMFPGGGQSMGGQPPGGVMEDDRLMKLQRLEQQRQELFALQQQQQQQQQLQQQLVLAGLNPSRQTQTGNFLNPLAGLSGTQAASAGGDSNMTLGALQRTNANAYLAMLMAQEKMQAQVAALGGRGSSQSAQNILDVQNNFMQAQQQQLEHFHQQRMLLAQQQSLRQQLGGQGVQQGQVGAPTGSNADRGKNKPKRASAA